MERSDFYITDNEITIFPDAIADFNKATEFLYVGLSHKLLMKPKEESVSFKMFS